MINKGRSKKLVKATFDPWCKSNNQHAPDFTGDVGAAHGQASELNITLIFMEKLIIISDLHLASGPLNDFDEDIAQYFSKFVEDLTNSKNSINLIFNGDFLDFVQSEPWRDKNLRGYSEDGVPLCFTEKQSIEKLGNIRKRHLFIFNKLDLFLKSNEKNKITIIPGNHDVDFFWPKVQAKFKNECFSRRAARQINIHLDQIYYPQSLKHCISIEHGHQYDPCNSFFINGKSFWDKKTPPIMKDTTGTKRLLECIGTRFLNKYINFLDEEFPFVDNIKPFSTFLLLFGSSAFVPGYGPYKVAFALWNMFKYLQSTILNDRQDILSEEDNVFIDPRQFLLGVISDLNHSEHLLLIERLANIGVNIQTSLNTYVQSIENANILMDYLCVHPDWLKDKYVNTTRFLDSGRRGYLSLSKGFLQNENELFISAAKKMIKKDHSKFVIMGHTHSPCNCNWGYLNTGSWTKYFNFADFSELRPWVFLTSQFENEASFKLNYVEIDLKNTPTPKLMTYMES